MTKFIGITSGKGGVGKTTIAINIAATLLGFGRSSILVDGDLSGANIALHLGLHVTEKNIHTVLKNKHTTRESIYKHPSGLLVLPGALSYEQIKYTEPTKLPDSLLDLVGLSEIVIVDTSSGYGHETKSTINAVDYVLPVTTPDTVSASEALKSIKIAQELGKTVLGVVVNRVRDDELEMTWRNMQTFLGHPVLGMIPEDDSVRLSQYLKNPVVYTHPSSRITSAYKYLAAQLIGEKYEENLPQPEPQKSLGYYILKGLGFI